MGSREISVIQTSDYVDPHKFYNVLWIEWVDGIAYRKGLGRVEKSGWESADTEEIEVVLG